MPSTPLTHISKLTHLDTAEAYSGSEPFEYPHFYTPTHLAKEASKKLQEKLKAKLPNLTEREKGRMFGVLVVESEKGLGYLSAYSGELQPELEKLPFVPPVYQLPKGEDFPEMASINAISKEIRTITESESYALAQEQLKHVEKETEENIRREKAKAKKAKAERRALREKAAKLPENERQEWLDKLAREGAQDGMDLRRFTRAENLRLEEARKAAAKFDEQINQLKAQRKAKSAELQDQIFKAYLFQNAIGETKDVKQVFEDFKVDVPPAGAGECAAPKLFQYAFQHSLKPIALAEFWWGPSPSSEIREHGKFYPACKRKCEPILSFMLQGISVKPNPLLENFGADKKLETLYEDEHLVIINKPAGLLSVPGKHIADSVQTRLQERYPDATGPMIVHRLDQDTSGLMIVTLTKEAHKQLQRQFLERTIHKTYVAVLERAIDKTEGVIDLPLILDIDNRPMQMVHFEHGKPAITRYRVLETTANRTLIELKPLTGRSHQLRVHCAHKLGLHAPIHGDNLYGSLSDRLCLHAQKIKFKHPVTGEKVMEETEMPFSV